jgi:hypothetical protein
VEVREGEGWRLVVDPTRIPFVALIGGADWASELTGREVLALKKAAGRLVEQHRALADGLMAEEALDLELELPLADPRTAGGPGGSLWLGLSGDRSHWSLRLVLTPAPGGRGLEGGWDDAASAPFAAALAGLDGLAGLVHPAGLEGPADPTGSAETR